MNTSKVGYISMDCCPPGTRPGEWSVLVSGAPTDYKIVEADDIEGYFVHYVMSGEHPVLNDEGDAIQRRKVFAPVTLKHYPS